MVVVASQRLKLREFVAADATAMQDVLCDPEVMRFGPGAADPDWSPVWIAHRVADYRRLGFGLWAVVRVADDELLGYCGLSRFPDIDGVPEIELGYRLMRRHWGRGYATEAAQAVRSHAFEALGVSRLVAVIDPANRASVRVAQKLGMRYEKDVVLDGYDHPDHLYVLDRPCSTVRASG